MLWLNFSDLIWHQTKFRLVHNHYVWKKYFPWNLNGIVNTFLWSPLPGMSKKNYLPCYIISNMYSRWCNLYYITVCTRSNSLCFIEVFPRKNAYSQNMNNNNWIPRSIKVKGIVDTFLCTEKTMFPFPFKSTGIWLWWQFSFRFWTKWNFI